MIYFFLWKNHIFGISSIISNVIFLIVLWDLINDIKIESESLMIIQMIFYVTIFIAISDT